MLNEGRGEVPYQGRLPRDEAFQARLEEARFGIAEQRARLETALSDQADRAAEAWLAERRVAPSMAGSTPAAARCG